MEVNKNMFEIMKDLKLDILDLENNNKKWDKLYTELIYKIKNINKRLNLWIYFYKK